ncbi:MAG TPA: hypothetical protein VKG43_12245 [Acidimicrobiales bacterium]|nr:hypothetical protein [Acidimicrobiales bacterium]
MPKTMVIRYRAHPEHADENERLIQGVFEELARRRPPGVRYAALRLDDGVSFVHVVRLDGDDNPLVTMEAFRRFQSDIGDRIAEGPVAAEATVAGSYGWPD